jgi:alkanesulfonate monooxygenase SsuD/methylene tetrahydromethanopterin reductase-like flavin-dependent oxidoreductase (luciferase family)
MRFGLFGSAQARRGDGDPARGFRDYVDTCVEAEALGFDSSFLVEHHFSGLARLACMGGGAHDNDAAGYSGHRSALARSGAAR